LFRWLFLFGLLCYTCFCHRFKLLTYELEQCGIRLNICLCFVSFCVFLVSFVCFVVVSLCRLKLLAYELEQCGIRLRMSIHEHSLRHPALYVYSWAFIVASGSECLFMSIHCGIRLRMSIHEH
jgi:hypothetical protein